MFDKTTAVDLVQVWDRKDASLYSKHDRRFTNQGKINLWRAIDKTIRFCDTNVVRNYNNTTFTQQHYKAPFQKNWNEKRGGTRKMSQGNRRYTWRRDDNDDEDNKRKLPPPPHET